MSRTALRNSLFAATVAVASISALVLPLAASAATVDAQAHAEHVEYMARIGLTPRYDAVQAPVIVERAPADAAARQVAWENSQRLAGRTLRWDEKAPADVSAEAAPRTLDEALATYTERANAAGRTVQWHEVHDAVWAVERDASVTVAPNAR